MSEFSNHCANKMQTAINYAKNKSNVVGDRFYTWLSPQFKVPNMRIAWFIDSYFGALLKSDQISKLAKRAWLTYHVFSSITVLVSSTSYIMLTEELTPFLKIYAYTPIISELTIICIYYIFYRFSQTKEIGRKLEQLHLEITGTEEDRDWSLELRLMLKYFVLPILFLFAKPIVLLLLSEENDLDWNDVEIYVYPCPLIHHISTPRMFLLMQFFQVFTYVPVSTSTKFFSEIADKVPEEFKFFFCDLKMIFKNCAEILAKALQPLSDTESSTTEFEPQLAFELQELSSEMNVPIKSDLERYERAFISCLERYQTLTSSFVSIKYQMEYGFAVLLVFVYPWLVYSLKQVFLFPEGNSTNGFVIFGLCLIHFHVLICCCELGEKFQRMVDMIYEETYATPWYQFNPKMKKTVYIFLYRTQQSFTFRAFKIIPINRSTLVRLFVKMYGIALFHVMIGWKKCI